MEKNCKTCAYNKNNKNSIFYNHNEKHCKGYDCYEFKKKFNKPKNKCDKYVIDIVNFPKIEACKIMVIRQVSKTLKSSFESKQVCKSKQE